jgi:hypothetical protein
MTIIRYYKNGKSWTSKDIKYPKWEEIERAIKRMENYCFPIVKLSMTDNTDDENTLNVIGGNRRWALFELMGNWEYSDQSQDDTDVYLWDSDQGYECKEKNVIKDINILLKYIRVYYETGSYEKLKKLKI